MPQISIEKNLLFAECNPTVVVTHGHWLLDLVICSTWLRNYSDRVTTRTPSSV